VPSKRVSRVADVVTGTAVEGLGGTEVSIAVAPGDTGPEHPAARIIPDNNNIRTRFLFIIITGCHAGTNKLSGYE